MKKPTLLISALFLVVAVSQAQLADLPANPVPGKCYIKCVTPEVYSNSEKRMLARPAYKKLEKTPAEYKTVEERIMTKPASKKYVYVPAEFKTVTEEIRIEDPWNEVTILPARLGTKSETIEVRPKAGRWEYQKNSAACKSDNPNDCLVLCYVETPAEFRTVNLQTVERDASFTKAPKGGKTMTLSKQVEVKAARVEEIEIPAEFKTITKRLTVKDEDVREVSVPEEYNVESIETLKDRGGVEAWEEIDCKLTAYQALPVFYELGSARLTGESRSVIDANLLKLMRDKPNIRIEINSHTDSRGSADDNQKLSQARAEAVVNYLVTRGIQRSRLVAVGFGESRLKNRCADGIECSESEHQANRRTEFRVLGGG